MPEHTLGRKPLRALVLALLLLASLLSVPLTPAFAEGDVHHLVFASDYHNTEGTIATALEGMPQDTEYVSMIGDMVGSGMRDMAPEYQSSMILGLVQESLPGITTDRFSIVWGSHDANVQDDDDVVKCNGGYGSSVIYEGVNGDGTTAYYIYAIGFYEMGQGGTTSSDAAIAFKGWVDGVDKTIPIIVLCHMPMQSLRADNKGAIYWNEALNYAATGVDGITNEDAVAQIERNVIFLCAHNHTVSNSEFYFPAGSTMSVQVDTSDESGDDEMPPAPPADMPELTEELLDQLDSGSTEGVDDSLLQALPRPPRREPKGVASRVYYTSLVAGYLKTNSNATLLTIEDEDITLQKFSGGQQVDLGVNGQTEEPVTGSVVIPQFTHADQVNHGSVQIAAVDEAEAVLDGAEFGLFLEDEQIATFQGGTFEISSANESLAQLLPAAGETLTLTLRETVAPQGYERPGAEHALVISATQEDTFDAESRRYVTTSTYEMRIDDKDRLLVAHTKHGVTPASVTITPVADKSTAATTVARVAQSSAKALPKTGDVSPIPYAAVIAAIGVALLATAVTRA